MRVVLVTTSYPHSADDASGHFVRAEALARARDAQEVHVVAPVGGALEAPRVERGITVHPTGATALFGWPGALARARAAPWRLALAPLFVARAAMRVAAIAERGPIDRLVAHWIVPCGVPTALLAAGDAPLEVVAHGADVRLLLSAPAPLRIAVLRALQRRRAALRFASARARHELAASLPLALAAWLEGASHVRAPDLELPVVDERARELRERAALGTGERLVVVAARLVRDKRVDVAIDAAVELGRRGRPARLVVLGDGPERAALVRRSSAAAGRVALLGMVPRTEALAWIAAADVVLSTSSAEGAPSVVREARAQGVPVVATAAGDIETWAAADPGIRVVHRADARSLADALCRVVW